MRQHDPIDYPAVAAKLGLKHTCRVHLVRPVDEWVVQPADNAAGALTVTLTEALGPWKDSPSRAILTITHRASGLCLHSVTGNFDATPKGLKLAKKCAAALRDAPGFDWSLEDPNTAGMPGPANVLHAHLAAAGVQTNASFAAGT